MSRLRISLFGGMTIARDDSPAEIKMTRVTQTLLAYLVLQRHRFHPRPVLVSLLWGDLSELRARNCLNTALWRLRSVLEPSSMHSDAYLVTNLAGEIGFNSASNYWLDAAILETQANAALARPVERLSITEVQELERALQLYRGDLLEGFYEDWALRERERLRDLYLRGLAHLMDYYERGQQFEQSIACGQQILRHDPLREEIHRAVMRLYANSGQRALAVRQYETCCQTLQAELGISPMEETQLLLAVLAPERASTALPPPLVMPSTAIDQALHQLHVALHHFQEAQSQLRRATDLVAQIGQRQ